MKKLTNAQLRKANGGWWYDFYKCSDCGYCVLTKWATKVWDAVTGKKHSWKPDRIWVD